ncbi:MAG: hypothetical protein HFH24_09230 [Ruminococcus sp.]|nr:hypothetical protein [Ruminococcus sp.]
MLFFTGYSLTSILVFIGLTAALIGLNEITRRFKWAGIAMYVIIPIIATFFIWPKTAGGNVGGTWFAWVKTYSALAGVIGFMLLRYIPKLQKNKFMLTYPALILAINILEAVYADLECLPKTGQIEAGLQMIGGPWNVLNAIAGILNIITITGWLGIQIGKTHSQDMVWADQLWFWIIAYDLWNLSYCYNCISNRSFYAGFLLLVSCTAAEFFIRRGAWLQHRAQTLALWAMFSLTVDYSAAESYFSITSTQSDLPKLLLSGAALLFNIGVLVYEIRTIRRTKKNPLKEAIYTELGAYKKNLEANGL